MNFKELIIKENLENINREIDIIQDFNTTFLSDGAKLEFIDKKILLFLK